jgi:hypothetical protein
MFELNKFLFLFLNDLSGFTTGKLRVMSEELRVKSKNGQKVE